MNESQNTTPNNTANIVVFASQVIAFLSDSDVVDNKNSDLTYVFEYLHRKGQPYGKEFLLAFRNNLLFGDNVYCSSISQPKHANKTD